MVFCVLNGKVLVNKVLKECVEKVVKELNYCLNFVVCLLVNNCIDSVGVFVFEFNVLFFGDLM